MLSGKLVSLTRHACRQASRMNYFREITGIKSPVAAVTVAASPAATSAAAAAAVVNLAPNITAMTYSTTSYRRKTAKDEEFDELKVDIDEAKRVAAIREKAVKTYQEKAKKSRFSHDLTSWLVFPLVAFIFIDYFHLDFWDWTYRETSFTKYDPNRPVPGKTRVDDP